MRNLIHLLNPCRSPHRIARLLVYPQALLLPPDPEPARLRCHLPFQPDSPVSLALLPLQLDYLLITSLTLPSPSIYICSDFCFHESYLCAAAVDY